MRQSSRPRQALPARVIAFALACIGPIPLCAQTEYRVVQPENFRRNPSTTAPILATVPRGVSFSGGRTQDGWVAVALEGWVWAESVEPSIGGNHDLRVTARGGENLRSAPNQAVVGRLSFGTLLDRVEREGQWIRVRRDGWMWHESLSAVTDVRRAGPEDAAQAVLARVTPTAADSAVGLDRAIVDEDAALRSVPEGDTVGALSGGAPVKILARSAGWVRVQHEAWVRESDLRPSSPGVLIGVSAAEVLALPEDYEGKLLQWTVQYVALQEADELRNEIPLGQPYMLARGPLPEAGFVYLVLSPEQRSQVERLPLLANMIVVGRVRTARSRFLNNPILDLIDFAELQPEGTE